MLMAQAMSMDEMSDVVKLQKWVLLGSLAIQLAGALVLLVRFLPEYGFRQALVWGLFHAISAFCNAGFDIFGSIAPGMSLITFNADPVVCITLMALVVLGIAYYCYLLAFHVKEKHTPIFLFRSSRHSSSLACSPSEADMPCSR